MPSSLYTKTSIRSTTFYVSTILISLSLLKIYYDIKDRSSLDPISAYQLFRLLFPLNLILTIFITYTLYCVFTLPKNNPSAYIHDTKLRSNDNNDNNNNPVLVCLGDSLTHGTCSANYIDPLLSQIKHYHEQKREQNMKEFLNIDVVNAGHNGICTYNVITEKLSLIQSCQPDYIVVLIGTNDIRGIYSKKWKMQIQAIWDIPEDISYVNYERNLTKILKQLLAFNDNNDNDNNEKICHPRLCVCTLPPFGEDRNSEANNVIRKGNEIIRRVVKDVNQEIIQKKNRLNDNAISKNTYEELHLLQLIDINLTLNQSIINYDNDKMMKGGGGNVKQKRKYYHCEDYFVPTGAIMSLFYYIFGVSWLSLSKFVGNVVLSDSIHLNEKGAELVANEIFQWLIRATKEMENKSS